MTVLSVPNTFAPNTTISSSEVNNNFSTIYNDYNGGISAANLASNAVTTAKIADSNVTAAKIADSNVTTAKIADDAVTASKIDWTSTGANGGIWGEELGRTILGSAGDTITVSSLPNRKYLMIIFRGIATGGTINGLIRFNNDTGNNYAARYSNNGAADTTSDVSVSSALFNAGTAATDRQTIGYVTNEATREKIISFQAIAAGAAGAANVPARIEGAGKWANTTDVISRIDVINAGTGDFAIGSEVIVLGHD